MSTDSYEDWISIYNSEIKTVWEGERTELRRVTMIYCAFHIELNRLKSELSNELSNVTLELKKRDRLEKCKKFAGLAQSERFDDFIINKENETPESVPLQELNINETKSENIFTESPKTKPDSKEEPSSPILKKSSLIRMKRKNSTSPPSLRLDTTPKINKTEVDKQKSEYKTPQNYNDSNIMECSIIEDTPDIKPEKKKRKRSHLQLLRKKPALNKNKQSNTLTQMFLEPKQKTKHIDSNLPSMTVTEMINLINESSSDSDTEAELDQSDATVDDLDLSNPADVGSKRDTKCKESDKRAPKENSPKIIYEEVVRGNERKKLKGWSCQECKDYYEGLNLSPEELQKKKDACSRHRFKFKPREETYDGFWDLTFGPTPPTQDSESIILNYKKW